MKSEPARTFDALRALAREGPVSVRVRGDCMEPWIAGGALVQVAAARIYWPGDVVVASAPDGRLLAHRVLGYRLLGGRLALVTRGDGCVAHDFPVPFDRVLGRVEGAGATLAVRARALGALLALARGRSRR
jgi:hypothetical protein